MTAVQSSNTGFFLARFLNNLKGSKKTLIINIILNIIGLPMVTVATIIMFFAQENDSTRDFEAPCRSFMVIGFCAMGVSVLLGSIVAMSQFRYLYKKTIVDMNYSLPLSGTQRFFADYLSGLTIYVLPPAISIIVSLIMCGMGQLIVDMKDLWENMPMILEVALIVILAMVQFYAISVFSLTFCGSGFESHFSTIAFIIMIPSTIGCLWNAIVETSGFGIAGEAIFTMNIFTSTNPAGSIAFLVQFIDNYDSYYSDYATAISSSSLMLLEWVFTVAVSIAFYVCTAWLLYRNRKAEDVSKPYVYRAFFYVLMTMGVFCILSLFIIYDGFIAAGIILCGVIWCILEIITRRGFKKFWTAPVGFFAAVAAVFAICGVCDVTDGFGASRYVPSSMNVEYVELDIGGIDYLADNVRYRDKEVIKQAIALNRDIVDRHFNPGNYSYNEKTSSDYIYGRTDGRVEFEYSSIGGSKTIRRYNDVYSGLCGDLVKAMLLSDEYAESVSKYIGSRIYSSTDEFGYRYNLSVYDSLRMNQLQMKRTNFTEAQIEEIRKAYEKDMKNMTEEELVECKVYCYIDRYWVLESFENTIAALDIDVKPIKKSDFNDIYVKVRKNPQYKSEFKKRIEADNNNEYYGSGNKSYILVDEITRVYPYSGSTYYDEDETYYTVGIGKENVLELVKRCTPVIFGEHPLAEVSLSSGKFYLRDTPENAELLESIDMKKNKGNSYDYYDYDDYDKYGWDYY